MEPPRPETDPGREPAVEAHANRHHATRAALALGGVHALVAVGCWLLLGVETVRQGGGGPWGFFWQNLPMELLRERPLESLWHLHAQPPLWNALGAALGMAFGEAHLVALHLVQIVLGAGVTVFSTLLAARLTGRFAWGVAAGVAVALHPALLLYEAYALYPVAVAFLLALASLLLLRARETRSPWALLAFVGALAALTLTRSLYHPVFLLAALPLGWIVVRRPGPRQLALLTLIVLLPFGWYAKNAAQHGFFGGSSWFGMGLWRAVVWKQDVRVLEPLLASGELDPVVTRAPFSPPSAYRPLGYDRTSPVPSLSRDDLHNVNVPAISRAYQESALAALEADPGRYLANVAQAYLRFSAPSTAYLHLAPNRAEIEPLARGYEWLLLAPLARKVGGADWDATAGGSLWALLIPGVVLANLLLLLAGTGRGWSVPARLRARAVPLFMAGAVAYTALVGSTMEFGENVRFKFPVEPLLIVLLAEAIHQGARRRGGGAAPLGSVDAPGPPD